MSKQDSYSPNGHTPQHDSLREMEATRDLLMARLSYYEEALRHRHGESALQYIRTEARAQVPRIFVQPDQKLITQ